MNAKQNITCTTNLIKFNCKVDPNSKCPGAPQLDLEGVVQYIKSLPHKLAYSIAFTWKADRISNCHDANDQLDLYSILTHAFSRAREGHYGYMVFSGFNGQLKYRLTFYGTLDCQLFLKTSIILYIHVYYNFNTHKLDNI